MNRGPVQQTALRSISVWLVVFGLHGAVATAVFRWHDQSANHTAEKAPVWITRWPAIAMAAAPSKKIPSRASGERGNLQNVRTGTPAPLSALSSAISSALPRVDTDQNEATDWSQEAVDAAHRMVVKPSTSARTNLTKTKESALSVFVAPQHISGELGTDGMGHSVVWLSEHCYQLLGATEMFANGSVMCTGALQGRAVRGDLFKNMQKPRFDGLP